MGNEKSSPSLNLNLEVSNFSQVVETTIKDIPKLNLLSFPNQKSYKFNYVDLKIIGTLPSEMRTVKIFLHQPSKEKMAVKYLPIPFSNYYDAKKEIQMKKLLREISVHQQLDFSKYIVTLYGFCTYEGESLICMELMHMSLSEFYRGIHSKRHYFPEGILGFICVSVLKALRDLKRVGIMHRDIKPNNILINQEGKVKLCDFGESRNLENDVATTTVGTILYWPPERFESKKEPYDDRRDIWSLGITLSELVYGKVPYVDEEGHEPDSYLCLQRCILNVDSEELIQRCFKNRMESYKFIPDIVRLCLHKYQDRPNCVELLYSPYCHDYLSLMETQNMQNDIAKIVKNLQSEIDKSMNNLGSTGIHLNGNGPNENFFENLSTDSFDHQNGINNLNNQLEPIIMDRIYGLFYGHLIGDALGSPFECLNKNDVNIIINNLKKKPIPMTGGGKKRRMPGQFSDDSEMILCLIRSLLSKQRFDKYDVVCSYVHWFQTFPDSPGRTTKNALMASDDTRLTSNWREELSEEAKKNIFEKIRDNVLRYNAFSVSNGCLMRVSPLAIAFRNASDLRLKNLAADIVGITHSNPVASDAVVVYLKALTMLIKGKSKTQAYESASNLALTPVVQDLLKDAKTCALPVKLPQELKSRNNSGMQFTLGDDYHCGYLGVALQNAFYELLHAESYEQGLEDTILRGGDTDTNGCITGALLGARFGFSDIPQYWIDCVKDAPPRTNHRMRRQEQITECAAKNKLFHIWKENIYAIKS